MPKFTYNAIASDGNQLQGTYMASQKDDVAKMLHQKGYYPTDIKKDGVSWNVELTPKKMKLKAVARFCTQLSSMLHAGVPISRALDILKTETEYEPLRNILTDVYGSIQTGSSLPDAFKPYSESFPVFFHSMITAGVTSGSLDLCLKRAGEAFTKSAKLNARIKGALIYPGVILFVMSLLVIMLLTFIIPEFSQIYSDMGAELPVWTLIVLGASDFLISNWILLNLSVAAIVTTLVIYLKTDHGRMLKGTIAMNLPLIGPLSAKICASRFCRTLSSLTSAGVALPEALDITARSVVNAHLEEEVNMMIKDVSDGKDLSTAMEQSEDLPPLVSCVTKLGEESGTLEEMLSQVADYYEEEADVAIQGMLALFEPFMILIMAAIVVPILLAALLPMFNMMDALM